MTVKDHYDRYLGNFYSWAAGDFTEKQLLHEKFFLENEITPKISGLAFDLGSGQGINAVALANLGFSVRAIDFNPQLLEELRSRIGQRNIEAIDTHLLEYLYAVPLKPELVVCMGDTLTHLSGPDQVEELIALSAQKLERGGKLVISYRELTNELTNEKRFIPVNSDENRIHTCYLEYLPGYVKVFDIFLEREGDQWKQTVSWYPKLRIAVSRVISLFEKYGLSLLKKEAMQGMTYLVAVK